MAEGEAKDARETPDVNSNPPSALRGRIAWHMPVELVLFGHEAMGFEYEIQGDEKCRKC